MKVEEVEERIKGVIMEGWCEREEGRRKNVRIREGREGKGRDGELSKVQ